MKKSRLQKILLSAMFLSLGAVLPLFTMQIKEIGDSLLPMHIPVMLCGLICGQWYGLAIGFILPIFRSFVFSMPPLYPNALWMAAELCTYGFVIGFIYSRLKKQNTASVYFALITAMLSGRIIWGIAKSILLGFGANYFAITTFISGAFIDSALGIIIQLILIPIIMKIIKNKGVIK